MRPQLYLFASGLFNQPTLARLEMQRGLLAQLLSAANAPWRETLIALEPQLNYDEDIETEYSRLFILAFPNVTVQPFGSYWLEEDQRLMGKSSLEIKEMMASHGIEIAENSGLLPDHIVSELEFMAYLASHEDTQQTQQQLLEQHLARWIPPFTAALRAAKPAPYYRLAADFIELLIDSEAPLRRKY
ncbi:MAG: molecular chaperone TorD family protein [Pseudomonadota bacterium]